MSKNKALFIKTLVTCACPPPDEPIKPMTKTPFDRCGYVPKCCRCVPLWIAASIICAISFFWVVTELIACDTYSRRLFPSKENGFIYFKYSYMALVILFGIACVVFLVGIFKEKYKLVGVYVWAGLVFHCIYIVIFIAGIVVTSTKGRITKKFVVRVFFGVIWNFFYFYLLLVVNSYRIHLYVWSV